MAKQRLRNSLSIRHEIYNKAVEFYPTIKEASLAGYVSRLILEDLEKHGIKVKTPDYEPKKLPAKKAKKSAASPTELLEVEKKVGKKTSTKVSPKVPVEVPKPVSAKISQPPATEIPAPEKTLTSSPIYNIPSYPAPAMIRPISDQQVSDPVIETRVSDPTPIEIPAPPTSTPANIVGMSTRVPSFEPIDTSDPRSFDHREVSTSSIKSEEIVKKDPPPYVESVVYIEQDSFGNVTFPEVKNYEEIPRGAPAKPVTRKPTKKSKAKTKGERVIEPRDPVVRTRPPKERMPKPEPVKMVESGSMVFASSMWDEDLEPSQTARLDIQTERNLDESLVADITVDEDGKSLIPEPKPPQVKIPKKVEESPMDKIPDNPEPPRPPLDEVPLTLWTFPDYEGVGYVAAQNFQQAQKYAANGRKTRRESINPQIYEGGHYRKDRLVPGILPPDEIRAVFGN